MYTNDDDNDANNDNRTRIIISRVDELIIRHVKRDNMLQQTSRPYSCVAAAAIFHKSWGRGPGHLSSSFNPPFFPSL